MSGGMGLGWLALAGGGSAAVPTGYGWALLKLVAGLVLICALAYLVLRWLSRHLDRAGRGPGNLRVVERCPLTPRQSLWLVAAGRRTFLLGASEGGLVRLAELEPEDLTSRPSSGARQTPRFSDLLRREGGRGPQAVSPARSESAGDDR